MEEKPANVTGTIQITEGSVGRPLIPANQRDVIQSVNALSLVSFRTRQATIWYYLVPEWVNAVPNIPSAKVTLQRREHGPSGADLQASGEGLRKAQSKTINGLALCGIRLV